MWAGWDSQPQEPWVRVSSQMWKLATCQYRENPGSLSQALPALAIRRGGIWCLIPQSRLLPCTSCGMAGSSIVGILHQIPYWPHFSVCQGPIWNNLWKVETPECIYSIVLSYPVVFTLTSLTNFSLSLLLSLAVPGHSICTYLRW